MLRLLSAAMMGLTVMAWQMCDDYGKQQWINDWTDKCRKKYAKNGDCSHHKCLLQAAEGEDNVFHCVGNHELWKTRCESD